MSDLLNINVNDRVEKKNGLSYLSWAWAWTEVLKIDPKATWHAHEFNGLPCCVMPDASCMVKVSVTIKDDTKTCLLPVMNHRNQAIKNPDAFAVNTAIMRCLAKAISMHGLGLYIYAGEDLPPDDNVRDISAAKKDAGGVISATAEAWKACDEDTQRFLRQVASKVEQAMPHAHTALELIELADLDNERKAALWFLLESTTRRALKEAAKEAA